MFKWFDNLKIRSKLLLPFVVVVFISALATGFGVLSMNQIVAGTQNMARETEELTAYERIQFYLLQQDLAGKAFLLTGDAAFVEKHSEFAQAADEYLQDALEAVENEEEREEVQEILREKELYEEAFAEMVTLYHQGEQAEAIRLSLQVSDEEYEEIGAIAADAREDIEEAIGAAVQQAQRATITGVISLVVSIVVASGVGLFLARRIVGPISQLRDVAERISLGDLSTSVAVSSKDELGDMVAAFQRMTVYLQEMASAADLLAQGDLTVDVTPQSEKDRLANAFRRMIAYLQEMAGAADLLAQGNLTADVTPQSEKDRLGNAFSQMSANLNDTISQTNAVVEQVVPSVEQMRAISQSLASSAEEQSAAVEEVASSLEETDAQVKSNAESANIANQLVSQTANVANAGQEKMKSMTEAMDAIAVSSQKISKIIKVIDEIAFQTNLLALNAAVEAARAGPHGRGFAVVAQEVRNLAGRSAKAARETAELIEDSSRSVDEGVRIGDETAIALNEIVQNVAKVKDLVAEIAAASDDQARGVAQISSAMLQVNQEAQANSQQSEELASTADELGNLAEVLREQTSRFKLREQQGHAPAIAGMTPEMLQQVADLIKSQDVTGAVSPTAAKPQAGNEGDDRRELSLDRDERGYGEF